ncbi:hypothetical protein NHQ30_010114 [Ciborinia camelliae]|nr:hypothetical protein NHQ30_010114 [Ciborinia camelliae]
MTGTILEDLPMELLIQIVSNLDRKDLQIIRYTCRKINLVAKQTLFATVFLRPTYRSFVKLNLIAKNDSTQGLVRSLLYDRRLTWGKMAMACANRADRILQPRVDNLFEFMIPGFRTVHGSDEESSEMSQPSRSAESLYNFHKFMTNHMIEQDYILTGDTETLLFRKALQSFNNLSVLKIQDIPITDSEDPFVPPVLKIQDIPITHSEDPFALQRFILSNISTMRQEMIPFSENGLHKLLNVMPRLPCTLKKLFLPTYFQTWDISDSDTTPLRMFQGVEEFEAVIIRLDSKDVYPSRSFIQQMWENMPRLKSLRIRFCGDLGIKFQGIGHPSSFGIYMGHQHFQHLRAIHFHDLIAVAQEFKEFMQLHSSTLTKLHLSGKTYFAGVSVTIPSDVAEISPFAWIEMIVFLGKEMSLDDFSLDGEFSTSSSEVWTTNYSNWNWIIPPAPPRPSQTSLFTRIHEYVMHKGESPFQRKPENDEEKYASWHPLSEWEYEEDNSWCFNAVCPTDYRRTDTIDYQRDHLIE